MSYKLPSLFLRQVLKILGLITICSWIGFATVAQTAEPSSVSAKIERIEQRIQTLSKYGANPEGGVSRVAFSKADIEGRDYIKDLMRQAGLTVRVDNAGNVIVVDRAKTMSDKDKKKKLKARIKNAH